MICSLETNPDPWTIGRLLSWTSSYLERHAIDDPRLAAEVLLASTVGCRRIQLYLRFEQVPDVATVERFRSRVKRAADHEPIAYIVGEKEFYSLSFRVTPNVLIPRPETERIVEFVVDHCRRLGKSASRMLDVGTGSGCIPIAVLTHLPGASAVVSDISPQALEVAEGNAVTLGVSDRVRAVLADGLDLPGAVVPQGGFDVLTCNPPYIPADDVSTLPRGVRDYEPRLALSDGVDGLSWYRKMGQDAASILADDGLVVLEVSDGIGPAGIDADVRICSEDSLGDRSGSPSRASSRESPGGALAARRAAECSGQLVHLVTLRDRGSSRDRVLVMRKRIEEDPQS